MEGNNIQTKNFFLYTRKSTDEPDRQILSIEAQLFELREFAKKEGIVIVREFVESKTAKQPGREVFNEMIDCIEKEGIQGILAWNPDRLARNSVDGGRIIYLIDTGQITTLKFPTFWFDPTPQGKFMLSIAFGQSKYYIDNLSVNIKRGIRQKLRNGIFPAWAPIGYINDKINHCIVADKDKSDYIRKVFRLYASGEYPLSAIRKIINTDGLVGKKNKTLSVANYQYILKNPIYYGIIRYNGELYEGKHDPIITKKLFDEVQAVMRQKSKPKCRALKPYLYRGLFHCAECGCLITAETQKGHNYLRCTKRKTACDQRYVREEEVNKQITSAIQKVSLPAGWTAFCLSQNAKDKLSNITSAGSFVQKLKDEIADAEKKLDVLLEMSLSDTITQLEYSTKKQKILNQKIEASEKLSSFEQKSYNRFELFENFIKSANQAENIALQGNFSEQKNFLQKIGSNFQIKDKLVIFDLKNPWTLAENLGAEARSAEANISEKEKFKLMRRDRDSNPGYYF
ncbi:MAG: recombinase family protein [bacterium]